MRLVSVVLLLLLGSNASGQQVRVSTPAGAGSGIAVAQREGKTLVLTCNHIPADRDPFTGRFPLAPYPLPCDVEAGGKKLKGTAIGGCEKADLCIVIVDGLVPVVPLAKRDALVGEKIQHWGNRSKHATGVALEVDPSDPLSFQFLSTCAAISGDSGAGVYNSDGEICAIICGRIGMPEDAPARGCAVSGIRPILSRIAPQFENPNMKKRTVQVEQTIQGADGKTFTRIITRDIWE